MNIKLPNFHACRILVVGDVMLDRYWHGETSRISPEAPVPVVRVLRTEHRIGGAGNVALNIVALGAQATVATIIGNDADGQMIEQLSIEKGVHPLFIKINDYSTIVKLRVMSQNQQLMRLDHEQILTIEKTVKLRESVKQYLDTKKINAVILSDYAKGVLTECQYIIQAAHQLNIPIIIDPKGHNFNRYRGATLLTPNLKEFETIVGKCINDNEIAEKGQQLIRELNLRGLLITRSEHGVTLLEKDHPALHIPAQTKEVYDVTGAGDTMIATAATMLASGSNFAQMAFVSNIAASIVVGKLGTAVAEQKELKREVLALRNIKKGVVDEEQLLHMVELAKARGESIIFTNGCFDILHVGHVKYLEQAKKTGDRLIVAVNTDQSIKNLKGPQRPINKLEARMAVLAGLSSVDWVIAFNEQTPERLINLFKPDILVKGGDYKVDEVVGAQTVLARGGEVKIMSFYDQYSSSGIIKKIKNN